MNKKPKSSPKKPDSTGKPYHWGRTTFPTFPASKPTKGENFLKMPSAILEREKRVMDQKLIRAMLMVKRDAINLCEQVARISSNLKLKSILQQIAQEEENHFTKLKDLLLELEKE